MTKKSTWAVPYFVFLVLFVVLPLLLIAVYAFTDNHGSFTLSNITAFFTEPKIVNSFLVSLEVALENTLICILIGYPAAYILADRKLNRSSLTAVLFILPMWINALMRTLATAEIFNSIGIGLGKGTLLFGLTYDYLPFMIYPIYTILSKMDRSYIEAAQDLGASPAKVFLKVTLPLSMPGVMSGVMMVFMPTVSTFAISEILTNNTIQLFGSIIQEQFNNLMWNQGAALSLAMLIIIGLSTLLQKNKDDN
ncbi:MAG: ABC transporter permease [Candidatus Cryptobacteroides sp.]|nr:ABC transporter permease [Bacteroidales bacterium]MDD7608867.1 ABC transporter permease [Bacteroidales bacterium]MDY5459631.1 ABC transporter permease [Candidatus Cryptobacteroides sp.]